MKVKFKEIQSGHSFMYLTGKVYDLPRNDALDWVRSGRADLIEDEEAEPADRPLVQEVVKKATRPVKRTVR